MNKLQTYLDNLGFQKLTLVQKEMLEAVKTKRNIVTIAPTGTGKTHAYSIPVLLSLDINLPFLQAIVLLPTNELVLQALRMFEDIGSDFSARSFYGGIDFTREVEKVKNNQPQIIFTTPEKLNQLLDENVINLKHLEYFILDEADMMFTYDFMDFINPIVEKLNPKQFILLSATLNTHFKPFINNYFGNFILVNTTKEEVDTKEYWLIKEGDEKLVDLLALTNIINPYLAIIFVNTKEEVDLLYEYLYKNQLSVVGYSSNLPVKVRRNILKDITNLKYQYVITTDLLSRGIDFTATHVINYQIPRRLEYFYHRSGRTGRMGMSGTVITFYDPERNRSVIDRLTNRGIDFTQIKITPEKLIKVREKSNKLENEFLQEARRRIPKPKKIKPNYKKKNRQAVIKKAKTLRRKKRKWLN